LTTAGIWFVVGVNEKYIASVSFGKDSLAMLLRLIEEGKPLDAVVFYDTGMEFDAIYRVRDKAAGLLLRHGIEYVELHPEEPFLFSMFEKLVKYRSKDGYHKGYGWCGGVCRWGTAEKMQAISRYKRSLQGPVTDYIGIAADEPLRFEKAHSDGSTMPLVDWGMKEADCLQYCRNSGWGWIEHTRNGDVDLYDVLDRVSCWCCRNKNLKELRAMHGLLPEYWERLEDMQARLPEPMKGEGKSVFDLARRFNFEKEWTEQGKKIGTREFFDSLNAS